MWFRASTLPGPAAAAVLTLAALAATARATATPCGTSVSSAALPGALAEGDVLLDTRTLQEYRGTQSAACTDKCSYGHHPAASLLRNPSRADGAAVYRDATSNE